MSDEKNIPNLVNDLFTELDKTGVQIPPPPPAAFGRLFYLKQLFIIENIIRTYCGQNTHLRYKCLFN